MEKEQPTFVPGNIRIDLGMDFTMSPGNLGLRWNIALIMAELGIQNDMAMDFLRELIKIEQENPWRVSLSCIALIKLRQNDSWGIISEQFNKGNGYFAFAAALLLGQLGKKELEDLGIENLSIGYTTDKIAEIKKILERNLNKSSNKYAKQYIKKIIKKLNIEMPSS